MTTTTPAPRHGHHHATERLRALHDAVTARGSTVVLVTAPDGGGKSHLVDSVLSGTSGVTSVLVRALPWEQDTPWVVAERILRRLPRPASAPGDGNDDGTAPEQAAPVDSLTAALENAGPGSLVVIDDADQADPASLRALGSALQSLDSASVCVVLTAASPPGGPSAALCSDLARETMRLGALGNDEVRSLVSVRTGREPSPAVARRILEYTEGEVEAVVHLADEAGDSWWEHPYSPPPLPASVEQETRSSLVALCPRHREVVDAAALLPPPVTLDALSALAAAVRDRAADDPDAVIDALDAAHRARLLRVDFSPGAATITFRSPLIRTAIQREIAPRERLNLHRTAARLAEQSDPDAALEHRAAASTETDPELCRALRDRALVHAQAGRWSAAGHAYLTSAALTPEPEVGHRLRIDGIDALLGAGRISEAKALSRSLERVRDNPRRDAVLGTLALHVGDAGEADTLLLRALRAGRDAVADDTAPDPVSLAQKFVLHYLCSWRPDQLRHWAAEVIGEGRPDQPEVEEARAVMVLGEAIDGVPRSGPGIESRLGGLAPAVAQRFEMASGWIALARDDLETARRRLGSAIPTADVSGSARISLWSQAWLARTHLLRGEWDEALGVVDAAARRLDELELDLLAPVVHWPGAVIRSMRGDHLGAAAHLKHLTTTSDAYPVQIIPSAMGRMQVAAAAGDYTSVRRAAEPLHALARRVDIDQPGYWPWHDLYAHALVLAGRLDEAEALIGPPEQRALELTHRSTLARLGAVRSRIAAVRGDVDECVRIFHASLEYLDGLAMPYYSARIHFGFGQTLRRAGRRREAHLALGTARDLYEQLGAHAYVERCDRERRAGGVDVARTGGNATLTPQERAVATIVAAGRTNGQAAEELFLSVKTIQYHLTRIYTKLGLSGRTELALYASRSEHPFGAEPDPTGAP